MVRSLVLRGKQVVLREKRLEDALKDYQWKTDPELARLDAAEPLTISFEQYLSDFRQELRYPSPTSRSLAIETHDGKHIGNCSYYNIDLWRGEAEIGIMIGDKGYWNQGYGSDALKTLIDHLFLSSPLRRLYLHTLTWNSRAIRCFEKCGFSPVREVWRRGQTFLLMELRKGPD